MKTFDTESYTIAEIKSKLEQYSPSRDLVENLRQDSRKGVQKLADRLENSLDREKSRRERWQRRSKMRSELIDSGYRLICGLDEAGRGALAGPVAAAAVILPDDCYIPFLDDSKQLDHLRRRKLAAEIKVKSVCWQAKMVSAAEIDRHNILQATKMAMTRAVSSLNPAPEYLLIDGRIKLDNIKLPQRHIEQGDARINSIAAASILAKVTRDSFMACCAGYFPHYNFTHNMGYGTDRHRKALENFGPCSLHRRSYKTVENACKFGERQRLPFGK